MNKNQIITALLAATFGVIATLGIMTVVDNNNDSTSNMSSNHMQMSMEDMNGQLEDKSGDEFDEVFIEMMIAHHEGAVDMAELIPSRAKHDEVKELGKEIIAAQTKEIEEMKKWQKDWNYSGDSAENNMHGGH